MPLQLTPVYHAELADQFIQQGVYLRNWTPRTVRNYRQALAVLRRALDATQHPTLDKASLNAVVVWVPSA